mgnify:CR=1 FL=1
MGDCWRHEIVVERIDEDDKSTTIVCTGGERACPPEDVGGERGYQEFLFAIADPTAEDHDRMIEWSGGKFDPEAFDLVAVNRRLMSRLSPNETHISPQ